MGKRITLNKALAGSGQREKVPARAFVFCLFFAMAGGGCNPDPVIKGSKTVTVGQEILITVEQGPGLLQNEFELKDSKGQVYTSNDASLEYRFVNENEISFIIPFGMSTGLANLYIGADGRAEGYTIELTVVRLAALLDENGFIHAIDTETGKKVGGVYLGHGTVTARLAADGNRIIATAEEENAVHFLSFDGKGLRPYSPSVESVGTGIVDAVFTPQGALLATDQGMAIIKNGDSGMTVLDGYLDVPLLRGLAGGQGSGRVIGLAAPSEDATDVGNEIYVVDLKESGPKLRTDPIDIGGTPGGAGHMVLSSDGSHLYVANRSDNTVTFVAITDTDVRVEGPVLLPKEQLGEGEELQHSDPLRVRLNPDGTELLVLCAESRSLVRYSVAETGVLQQKGTLMLSGLPFDVGFSGEEAYIIVDNNVKKADLSAAEPPLTTVDWENTAAAVTIMLQP